ncbi:transmembrane amino acid transporter protein-domain-containing protein [Flammula alnicola]|nr:transmembrane amino acid transporter protein-domain-containing protein [Flammula alnicola]
MASSPLCLAYYCSGHGYGHATRVSAFARHLLSSEGADRPLIYIVSSAPEHVFADSIACGARYRYAEIDPVIVQPLAYRVDRRKSVEVLKKFLSKKDELLERERQWLLQVQANSVLSDAAFLGCLAARAAGLPSVLITNFSFDAVYSYLSTALLDVAPQTHHFLDHDGATSNIFDMVPDVPIPHAELAPLVEHIYTGYRCADLLVLLPGHIPIPSFFVHPPLPSFEWIDVNTRRMRPEIMEVLLMSYDKHALLPSIPFSSPTRPRKIATRSVLRAPLLVRPPDSKLSVYTPEGRARLLSSIGIPPDLHDPAKTRILIVSFGGQVFRRPKSSRSSSRSHSRSASHEDIPGAMIKRHSNLHHFNDTLSSKNAHGLDTDLARSQQLFQESIPTAAHFELHIPSPIVTSPISPSDHEPLPLPRSRLATPCHIWIPGAPPASKPPPIPSIQSSTLIVPTINTIPPTPMEAFEFDEIEEDGPRLLPDSSWIAVVCGVSKEQWNNQSHDKDSELPEGFYVAPRDVYMPDLTAAGDVLLGKLGYGTVSECVDACTPFVYVSRPLFIEEHGLRLLLDQEGVGVELSRQSYEAGDWASAVKEALTQGEKAKDRKRRDMANGIDIDKREKEGKKWLKAKVLARHLVPKEQRTKATDEAISSATSVLETPSGSETDLTRSRRSSGEEDSEPFPIPYERMVLMHDIYKWHTDQRRQAARVRSASFAGPSQTPHPAFEHIHEPGGFRRNYVLLRANEQGAEEPQILNNFIDFLLLFGHFAGEDLEEEEEDKEDEETGGGPSTLGISTGLPDVSETTALLESPSLSRSRSRSRRRKNSVSRQGTATVTQAVLMLLKSFVGTGVLFLGKAFFNGGILFSALLFVFIACISLYSFLLLVKTKFVVSGSFGDMGGALYGPWMRYLILGSIVVSQMGFVGAYTIFVAENLQAFVLGVTQCVKLIPVQYFILIQLVVFLPLALVRDLAKLSTTALVADVFILAGLIYIFGSEISIIADRGIADVKLFNPKDFPLFVGTAVFSFEGIGLVIPITDAMREPHKFPKALTGVMMFLMVLFGGAGALAYLTFGSDIQTVVLVNLNPRSKMVQSVQFLYACAILLSVPLQLFPAVRILENGIFTAVARNLFRFAMVLVCTTISWVGAADLDKFVAFVGCFACVPLCYVYPAMLHYKACSRTRREKLADIALIVFGLLAAAYTTVQTLKCLAQLVVRRLLMTRPPFGVHENKIAVVLRAR